MSPIPLYFRQIIKKSVSSLTRGASGLAFRSRLVSVSRLASPALVVGAVLVALFLGLLRQPDQFPGAPARADSATPSLIGIADAVYQSESYRNSGEIPYLAPGSGSDRRNLAVETPALFTHPLYFALQRFLPLGLSMTVLVILHVFLGAVAAFYLARRCRYGPLPSLFASLVFFLTGKLLSSGTQRADEIGYLLVAAVFPAVVLAAMRVLQRPTVIRGSVFGLCVALCACAGDAGGAVFAFLLLAISVPITYFLLDVRAFTGKTVTALAGGFVWGLALGGYRWLPAIIDGDVSPLARAFEGLPWWSHLEGISLPYHLGAVTLITVLLGLRNLTRQKSSAPVLLLGTVGIVLAVLGPPSSLPFLGLYFGLLGAAAFSGFLVVYRPAVREVLATCGIAFLIFEAMPHHAEALKGNTYAEIASVLETESTPDRGIPDSGHPSGRATFHEASVLPFSAPLGDLTALVNAKPASLFSVGNDRLELALPAGTHEVHMRFSPPGLELGQTLSAMAAALMPFLFAWPLLRRRNLERSGRHLPPHRFLRGRRVKRKEPQRQTVSVG